MPRIICKLPESCRRVIISANPHAGARRRDDLIHRLVDELIQRGCDPQITTDADELTELAQAWTDSGDLRAIVAAGGDGTAAFVANRVPSATPLALLPLGTENLLSKYLEIGADPAQLAEIIALGTCVTLDAGQAGERLFLLMCGVGFDADVVRRVHAQRQGHISHLAYAKPILDAIRSYEYPAVQVACRDATGEMRELTARWVFVVNVPRYAGGLAISPDAVADDGLLNVCAFREGSFLSGLIYLSGVLFGQHQNWDDYVTLLASEVRITAEAEVPYQLDGDPGGVLPVDIKILPARLKLLVSADWAQAHGYESPLT